MHKDTGKFINEVQYDKLSPKEKDDYLPFFPGERITIKGQIFIVCREVNSRLVIRSEKIEPTIKEKKVEEKFFKQVQDEMRQIRKNFAREDGGNHYRGQK